MDYKVEDIIDVVERQMEALYQDENYRDRSFEHCYTFFQSYRKDSTKRIDITLHLFSFLASWGMLRNSFLMGKDYLLLSPVVDILCDDKYDDLIHMDLSLNNSQYWTDKILLIRDEISSCYGDSIHMTETLISKILLGTFGCVPAYDDYLKSGLKMKGMCQTLNRCSLSQIFQFASQNIEDINCEILNIEQARKIKYPVMKIIDSYFWQIGKQN